MAGRQKSSGRLFATLLTVFVILHLAAFGIAVWLMSQENRAAFLWTLAGYFLVIGIGGWVLARVVARRPSSRHGGLDG